MTHIDNCKSPEILSGDLPTVWRMSIPAHPRPLPVPVVGEEEGRVSVGPSSNTGPRPRGGERGCDDEDDEDDVLLH